MNLNENMLKLIGLGIFIKFLCYLHLSRKRRIFLTFLFAIYRKSPEIILSYFVVVLCIVTQQ
jgi:hypothetical protein